MSLNNFPILVAFIFLAKLFSFLKRKKKTKMLSKQLYAFAADHILWHSLYFFLYLLFFNYRIYWHKDFKYIFLQFGMFETAVSAFVDEFPSLLKKRKTLFTAFLCFILFLLGLPIVTEVKFWYVYILSILSCMRIAREMYNIS